MFFIFVGQSASLRCWFHGNQNTRRTHQMFPKFAMDLKILELPVQEDYSMYKILMNRMYDENEIVRWYISSIQNEIVTLEIVVEHGGVGMSSSKEDAAH